MSVSVPLTAAELTPALQLQYLQALANAANVDVGKFMITGMQEEQRFPFLVPFLACSMCTLSCTALLSYFTFLVQPHMLAVHVFFSQLNAAGSSAEVDSLNIFLSSV